MIVETSQMQKCGEGTPMFSRRGKATTVLHIVFNKQGRVPAAVVADKDRQEEDD